MASNVSTGRTWLVSYPKSGNTWFRFVLFFLAHERMPESSRELDTFMNAKLPPRDAETHKKSHARAERLDAHLKPDDRIVYIYRHPLDVLQSAANYAILNGEIDIAERDAWIDAYISHGGHEAWMGDGINAGSWTENVMGWLGRQERSVHAIRYEAAVADPQTELKRLSEFLGENTSPEFVSRCSHSTSFDALRAFEENEIRTANEQNGSAGRFTVEQRLQALRKGVRFFNKGAAESFRDAMSQSQIERAWSKFGPAAKAIGYTI